MRNSRGFTLIEIIISIVLVGIIAGVAALIIMKGVRAYSDETSRSNVHYQARLAMERMAREVKIARNCGAIIPMAHPAATLAFTDINNIGVAYSLVGTNLMRNAADILAQNVTALQFQFLDINGNPTASPGPTCGVLLANTWLIEITMTVTDPQTAEFVNMRTRVQPRNF